MFHIPTKYSSCSPYQKEINNELETCNQELLATKQELVEAKKEMTKANEQMEVTKEHVIQFEANQTKTQCQLAETQRLIACLMVDCLWFFR